MADQLVYNDIRKTVPQSAQMPREDDRHIDIPHVLGPASAIKEIYFRVVDDEGNDVMSLTWEDDPTQFETDTDNLIRIWLKSADSSGLIIAQGYKWGCQIIDQADLVYTPAVGTIIFSDDVVSDGATAPHLTWTTRQDLSDANAVLLAQIVGIASCNDVTALSADATSGATSLTVLNGAILSTSDVVRIMLNDLSYDERTLTSVVGNVIGFTGGISDDADTNNIVRKYA